MTKNLFCGFFITLLLLSCSKTPPSISVVCEENSVGNAIVKWETSPSIPGVVKIYGSTNPNDIKEINPVAVAPISDGRLTIITDNPTKRYYYKMVFDNKYRVNTATRNVNISGVQNFRDLGGYRSLSSRKNVKWGKLYRCSEVDTLDSSAKREFRNMGIKTIIDLRGVDERNVAKCLSDDFNVVNISIPLEELSQVLRHVKNGAVTGDTVNNIMERLNRDLVQRFDTAYEKLFTILLDKNTYPAVITCSSGKGRTGIASALVLYALGVSDELVTHDYMLTNTYFNIPKATSYGYRLPARAQESLTAIFMAKENFINAAKKEIKRRFGDVDTYIHEGIGVSKEDRRQLMSILLE